MKKPLSILFLMLFSFCTSTYAQIQAKEPEQLKKNIIKVNPLSFGVLTLSSFYERAITDQITLQAGLGATLPFSVREVDPNNPAISTTLRFTIFSITPELRFYPANENTIAPEGFYIGPFIRYRTANFAYREIDRDFPEFNISENLIWTQYAIGAVAGYQTFASDIITVDFFGGPFYKYVTFIAKDNTGTTNVTEDFNSIFTLFGTRRNIGFRAGMTVGLRF